jgi:phytoene dehydrogenase-like protein
MEHTGVADCLIIGGGLSGLAAATYLARAGRTVLLCEAAHAPGGRARSREESGFTLNQGPHALYLGGPAQAVLRELAIAWTGAPPRPWRCCAPACFPPAPNWR